MNLAILGAGYIAGRMAQTLTALRQSGDDTVRLYAVAARDGERARAFAARHGAEKAYGSYEEMLRDPAVDLVYIATPHSHHYEHIKLCAVYGKHVLCEKAFTVSARQADDAIRYAKSRGVLVTEAIWTRYQPMRRIINETLASGVIGQPQMLTANLCYVTVQNPRIVLPELAGGALLDVGVYTLNLAEMVFGPSDGIQAACTKNEHGVDLLDTITLTWRDGRVASLTAGTTCVSDQMGIIYGTEGYLIVDDINNPTGLRIFDPNRRLVRQIPCPPKLTGYEYEVLETVRCIREGRPECPSMPHRETIRMMELMDHARAQMGLRYPCEGLPSEI